MACVVIAERKKEKQEIRERDGAESPEFFRRQCSSLKRQTDTGRREGALDRGTPAFLKKLEPHYYKGFL